MMMTSIHYFIFKAVNEAGRFQENLATLSESFGASNNLHRLVDQFLERNLIPLSLAEDISSGNITGYQSGSKLARGLLKHLRTCQNPEDVLFKICSVLIAQDDSQLQRLGLDMNPPL